MTFISYAQNNEDVLLWRALGHVPPADGFYIDVGASDPVEHSVTKAFHDAGWRGINIEPLPAHVADFKAQRPRDVTLAVAAGSVNGSLTLYDVPAVRGWASPDPGVAAQYRAEGHAVTELTVPVRTLASVCAEHAPRVIHFLKIDVEGFEDDVLRGMDFDRWRPWVLVIEATLPNSRAASHAGWEPLVLDARYRFAWFDGLNRYYVAAEHAALLQHFGMQPNVFDDYISWHLDRARDAVQRSEGALRERSAAIQATQAELQATQAELEAARTGSQAAQAELQAMRTELQAARAGLHQARAQADRLEQERQFMQRQVALLEQERQQARQHGVLVAQERQDALHRAGTLALEKQQALRDIEALRQEKQAALRYAVRVRQERQAAARHIDALKRERQAALRHVDAVIRDKRDALRRAGQLDEERQAALAEAARLRHELAQAHANGHQAAQWGRNLEQRLLATLASTSWKVTHPLRMAGTLAIHLRSPGLVRRTLAGLSANERLRRTALPFLMRHPRLARRISAAVQAVKLDPPQPAPNGHALPAELQGLPASVRAVLSDLRRARNHMDG